MIENIRKHSKIVIGVFVFVSLAFIAEEGIVYFLRYKDKNKDFIDGDILVVGGERVKYSEFKRQFEAKMNYWGGKFGITKNDSFWSKYLKNNLVTEMINDISFKKMSQNIGLKVGKDEIIDLVQGDNISEQIKQGFLDKDGVFKKEKLLKFLKKMSKNKEMKNAWEESEQQLRNERNKEKLTKILKNIVVFNDIICEQEWKKEKAKVDIEYLYIPYSVIKDEECIIDEKCEKEYLRDHQMDFQREESYKIKYFVLNYSLSEDDIKNNTNSLSTLKDKFAVCSNSVEFAKIKSDKEAKEYDRDENILKCSQEDLPGIIKEKNDIKVNDVFIEIAGTIAKPNKIYKVIKKSDSQYEIAVIYKKPFVSENTKEVLLQKLIKSLKNVNKKEDFEEMAKEFDVKVKNKNAKLDEANFEGVDDSRELMHNIFKNYKKPLKNFVFKIEPFKTSSGVFCGVVEKHEEKGVRDFEDIRKDLKLKCLQKLKFEKIVQKLKDANLWNLTFDEIKNKNVDFIKFGKDSEIGFDAKRIKEYGRSHWGMNNIFLLKKGENTLFFEDDNGALMIKVVNIKNDNIKKDNEEYDKFYKDKIKNKDSLNDIDKLFEQRFRVENLKNFWM